MILSFLGCDQFHAMMKNVDDRMREELKKQFSNSTVSAERPYLFHYRTSDDDWVFKTHMAKDRYNFLRLDINNEINSISVGIDPVSDPVAAMSIHATTYAGLNNITSMLNNQQYYCKIGIEFFYVGRRLDDDSLNCVPRLKCLYLDTPPPP